MNKRVRCILFDYGGTLDAPGEHWSHLISRAWTAAGADIPHEEFRRVYVLAERALATAGAVGADDNFLSLMRKKIALENTFLSPPFPAGICEHVAADCYHIARRNIQEVKPILEHIAAEVPVGIVSNFYGNLRAVLADMDILNIFSAVTDSGEAGMRKPDRRIFTEALCRIDPRLTPSEALMVGDSIDKDIIPAHSLGFKTALLPGIPWDPASPQPRLPAETIQISSIAEILRYL